jgi:hypothetical protein
MSANRQWRASITPIRSKVSTQTGTVLGTIVPDDCASEADAQLAAEKIIKKL